MVSRRTILGVIGAGTGLCFTNAQAKALKDHGAGLLDQLARDQIAGGHCAGLAVGLRHKGKLVLSKGYGLPTSHRRRS